MSAASDPASATTPAVSVLFHDGFESGDLSQWTNPPPIANPVQTGLAIDTTQVSDGAFSARSTVNGNAGSAAWHTLAQPESNLYYTARFKAISHTGQVNLMRLRNGTLSSGAIASLALSTTNKLTLRNDAAGSTAATTLTSTVSAATGAWHTLQLHAQVNGASSVLEVWLDGNPVPELGVTEDLGTNPVAKIELGDPGSTTSTKTFDIAYDEVAYDREFIGDLVAPTAPTGLTAIGALRSGGRPVLDAWQRQRRRHRLRRVPQREPAHEHRGRLDVPGRHRGAVHRVQLQARREGRGRQLLGVQQHLQRADG